MSRIAVIDFETTGGSPALGDRATEIAIVMVEDGTIVDHYQSLMRSGRHIPAFITQLTGITNAMVAQAPSALAVMDEAARFVGNVPLVAHNAAFDRRFWQAELAAAGLPAPHPFACTVMLSRRLYPGAPSHRLGALADYHALPSTGQAHRALADAELTAHLLCRIQADLRGPDGAGRCDHDWLMRVQSCPKGRVRQLVEAR